MTAQAYLAMITELVAQGGHRARRTNVRRAADLITAAPATRGGRGAGLRQRATPRRWRWRSPAGPAGWCRPTGSRCATSSSTAASRARYWRTSCWSGDPRWRTGSTSWPRSTPADVFVLASNSGINGVVVELALLVKERGHDLIAVTSLEHTGRVAAAAPLRQAAVARSPTWCWTTARPYGDVVLPNQTGAVSSVTAAVLAQMVVTEVVDRLAGGGRDPAHLPVRQHPRRV